MADALPPPRCGARRTVALVAGLTLAFAAGAADPIRIITYGTQSSPQIERGQLRALFTMRMHQWPDGTPVRVFVLPDSDSLHDRFAREVLGTYPYVLREVWDRQVFTGTGFAPTVVGSEEEMRRRVAATPGAIGYVSRGPDDRGNSNPAYRTPSP